MYKASDRWYSGIPDIHVCLDGMCLWIELKVPGKNADPIQKYTMAKIREAGGRTAVCHSVEEVKQFMDEIKKMRCQTQYITLDRSFAIGE